MTANSRFQDKAAIRSSPKRRSDVFEPAQHRVARVRFHALQGQSAAHEALAALDQATSSAERHSYNLRRTAITALAVHESLDENA